MKHISVTMIRPQLNDIPQHGLPAGYGLRNFRDGDERYWAAIEVAAGEFKTEDEALTRFRNEFGDHVAEMQQRCLFLINSADEYIGTTTAWYGKLPASLAGRAIGVGDPGDCGDGVDVIVDNRGDESETFGRIHWVAIIPDEQGKGLAKPLLTAAMNQLATHRHTRAYLTTQTTSWKAVGMYLDFGFVPYLTSDACVEGWTMLEQELNRNIRG